MNLSDMENVKYIPGDLVRSNNNPKIIWKVKDVSQDKKGNVLYRLIAVEEEEAFIYLNESQIAPIPLTPEILEKNGWEKDDLDVYFKRIGITFIFLSKLSNGDWSVCSSKSKLINCKHVHQLQHLLFGLGLDNNLKV